METSITLTNKKNISNDLLSFLTVAENTGQVDFRVIRRITISIIIPIIILLTILGILSGLLIILIK